MPKPKVIKTQEEIDSYPPFPFPFVGVDDYPGFKYECSILVDNSGLGRSYEPALTPDQLKKRLQVGKAYGVIDFGQFQLTLGEYEKVSHDKPKRKGGNNEQGR